MQLEEIEKIKQLKHRYCRFLDTADAAGLEAVLTEDIWQGARPVRKSDRAWPQADALKMLLTGHQSVHSEERDAMTTAANRDLFINMLTALGEKDFHTFEAHLAEDVLLEWPFAVMEGFPSEQRGARWFRDILEVSWRDFDPYAYRIEVLHDMADDNMLVAEYSSHSRFIPTNTPYSNRYISIVEFENGRISRWREYLNPQIIANVLGAQAEWNASAQGPVGTVANNA